KRVAYELRPRPGRVAMAPSVAQAPAATAPSLPQAPRKPAPDPVAAADMTAAIDRFLATRGAPSPAAPQVPAAPGPPVAFVCEDDVRSAVRAGARIVVGPRTIITPAARDAGNAADILVWIAGAAP
ncbi:MAG: hypothetical protein ABI880_11025, partial [Acidobacteriota bacterium]